MFGIVPGWIALIAIGVQQGPPARAWRLSEHAVLTLGAVDGTGPDVFGRVAGASRLSSGAVMAADGMSVDVRLFSDRGRLLNRAGGRGEGPGEFRTILSMRRCAGDSVFVYDPASFRVSVFGPNGNFARAIDVRKAADTDAPPYEFFCGSAGVTAYLHRSLAPPVREGPRRPDVTITVVQRNGAVTQLGRFPASERYFDGSNDFPRPLGKLTSVAIGSDAVYVGTGDHVGAADAFEIAVFSLRGERVGTVRETRSRTRVTRAHIARFIDEQIARRSGQVDERALHRRYAGFEYPTIFPAFARLMVDPADNLWIEQYPLPGEDARAWRVYSRAGAAISTVEMPEGFRLMEAGDDYVLGTWRDDLDVQFVRVYRLIK
ncbi:MAG: hypothetical protein ACREON_18790 [Gemmatimonadaceae bacterium]